MQMQSGGACAGAGGGVGRRGKKVAQEFGALTDTEVSCAPAAAAEHVKGEGGGDVFLPQCQDARRKEMEMPAVWPREEEHGQIWVCRLKFAACTTTCMRTGCS